jgi:Lytic transglycolase
MRRRIILRRSRVPRLAYVLPALLAPALGAGLAEAATSAGSSGGSHQAIQIKVTQRRIGYGQRVTVTGHAPSGTAGRRVRLDFAPEGTTNWRPVGQATVGRSNKFWLQARLRKSGRVKVKGMWSGSSGSTGGTSQSPDQPTSGNQPTSDSRQVKVAASFHLARHATADMGGHPITVQGQLLPATGGRRVRLQVRSGRRWQNVAHTRTGAQGRFHFRYRPSSGKKYLRVSFGGDRSNTGSTARSGSVTVFHQGVASWYSDGGAIACGTRAHYGVANVSLPCGTKVTFLYHGHRVTATVDDRGPYVSGRQWDLNQNTAHALGFDGVNSVWASR